MDCIVLFVIAAAIRLVGLGRFPIWSDELFTVFWSQLSPAFLIGRGARIETNPSFYYLMMHYWIGAFGQSALALRIPTLLFSAATVVVIYLIAERLFERRAAIVAALLATVDPFMIYYAGEIRPYAIAAFLQSLTLYALSCLTIVGQNRRGRYWPAAVFVLASSFSIYFHYTSAFFIASCFLVLGSGLIIRRETDPKAWAVLIALAVLVGLLTLYPVLEALQLSHSVDISWVQPLQMSDIFAMLWSVLISQLFLGNPSLPFCLCAILLVIGFGSLRLRLTGREQAILLFIPLTFLVVTAAISIARPIFLPRIGLWLVTPLCILLGRIVTLQPSLWRRWAAFLVFFVIWSGASVLYIHQSHKEQWPAATDFIARQPACTGPILFGQSGGLAIPYYRPDLGKRPLLAVPLQIRDGNPMPLPEGGSAEDLLESLVIHARILQLSAVPSFISSHPGSVLMLRDQWNAVLQGLPKPTAQAHPIGITVACFR